MPEKSEWKGKGGTISIINMVYPDFGRRMIESVLLEATNCESINAIFEGKRKERTFKGEYLVPAGSKTEQSIADLMEAGHGYKRTTKQINKLLKRTTGKVIGASAIRESYLCLSPVSINIKKVPQGSNNAHSKWAKASFNWAKQLAICFGVLDPRTTLDPPMPPNPDDPNFVPLREIIQDPVPPWFDPEQLELYDRHQVATHPKCDL